MSSDPEAHEGPLAEYVALRAEILARQATQQNLLSLQLTISGAVISFALTSVERNIFLLILPFTSYMLAGRYGRHYVFIKNIGIFMQEILANKIPGGLHWEQWSFEHPQSPRLPRFINPLFVTFPGAAVFALMLVVPTIVRDFITSPSWQTVGLSAIWLFGAYVAILTIMIIRTVVRSAPQDPRRKVDEMPTSG